MADRINSRTIRRLSLHDETVAVVREMILDGTLLPGERIAEQALCEELGISRTPLREALKVLGSEGLVELMPSQGSIVTEVTLEDVEAMFEMLEGLEEQIGRLAAARAADDDVAELHVLHARMLQCHRDGQRTQYFDINQQIHLRLAECACNRFLFADYERYQGKIRRARYLANLSSERWDESAQEHEAIMAALDSRDPETLSAVLGEHLRHTADIVVAAIRKQQEAAGKSPLVANVAS